MVGFHAQRRRRHENSMVTRTLPTPLQAPPVILASRISRVVVVVACIALFAFVWHQQLPTLAYYWVRMQQALPGAPGVGLPDYAVTIDARVIKGIPANVSDLTYSSATGTLFAVINNPPQVAELTTDGNPLRIIPLDGIHDPEGITHVEGKFFIFAAERNHQLVLARIDPEIAELDLSAAPRLGLGINLNGNRGFEGVAWDPAGKRLFVVQEKSPVRVLEITGFMAAVRGEGLDLQVTEWAPGRLEEPYLRDLSSVSYDAASGHLLLLSDESRMAVEYDGNRDPVGVLPLRRGWHGLARDVPQAEGITLGPDGTLYVVSEPNLFYRYQRSR